MPIPQEWAGSSQEPERIAKRTFSKMRGRRFVRHRRGAETQKYLQELAISSPPRGESDRRGVKAQGRVRELLEYMQEQGIISSFQETARAGTLTICSVLIFGSFCQMGAR